VQKELSEILPVFGVEHDSILSKQGDITIAWEVQLPELFTLSDQEYEALHQSLIKAIKILPKNSIFHKQDWFTAAKVEADFSAIGISFLSRASERFFHERDYLDHRCFILLTRKPEGRKPGSSLFSNLLRRSIVPEQTLKPQLLQDFLDAAGQFEKIIQDSGFIQLNRMRDAELTRIIEGYLTLSVNEKNFILHDIDFTDGIHVGPHHCQLFSLADAADLPAWCGSRINYDKYSTDKTKFSIGFASPLGQLLSCNHIYNQYIFIEDAQRTLQKLESKRLRLHSLSAYSRENSISRDATNEFLNEAIAHQRLPVKCHLNVFVWTDNREQLKDTRNLVSSALSQMDAVPKQELSGAPQIFGRHTGE
jgi:conjugation system TraG family ATPase